ncbi:MAG: hypothetical protein HY814_07100 [Candidatus Riflebacteria bacterium]|nr:hypothetical protein [Candidatus Riflebacteria bacterium]
MASVLEVIQDLGIEANITPSRRFDPLPDVSSAEVYKAAAGLEAAIAALKKLGHPTDELEKELTMLECRYKLWLVRARRRPERPFTRPTGGKRVILNLGLNVLYLYRVIVEGKALVGFRRPPRRPGQVYPCVLCEKDAPLVQHGPLPDKTVYREIANLLTLLQFRPEKESAVPGAPWTAAAVRRLVERYRSSEPLEIRS